MSLRTDWRCSLFWLVLVTVGLSQGFMETPVQVRLTDAKLNYLAMALFAVLFPMALAWFSLCMPSIGVKVGGTVISVLVALPLFACASLAVLEASHIENDIDNTVLQLSEASAAAGVYRLYRTDCGATCSFGLLLRLERDLPLGIKLVTKVWSTYPEEQGALQVTPSGHVQVVSKGRILKEISQ